jgi:putative membrane protein
MNNTINALGQDPFKFAKLIVRSTCATLVMALMSLVCWVPLASAATTLSTPDQDFIMTAAQINLTEIKLGEFAAQTGMRDDVKAFGQRMVKDHTAINDDLKVLAAQKDVAMPDSLDAAHQKMVDTLTALTGSEFDKAYIAGMFKGHKKAIKAFKTESAKTKDADVKSFAGKTIPILEDHLKLITAIKKS